MKRNRHQNAQNRANVGIDWCHMLKLLAGHRGLFLTHMGSNNYQSRARARQPIVSEAEEYSSRSNFPKATVDISCEKLMR